MAEPRLAKLADLRRVAEILKKTPPFVKFNTEDADYLKSVQRDYSHQHAKEIFRTFSEGYLKPRLEQINRRSKGREQEEVVHQQKDFALAVSDIITTPEPSLPLTMVDGLTAGNVSSFKLVAPYTELTGSGPESLEVKPDPTTTLE